MANNPKFDERLKLLRDTVQHEHTDRVAHFSNFFTWKILDSDMNVKLSEALGDYSLLDRIQCEFQERYDFDVHYDLLARNLLRPSAYMGGRHHMVNDESESINFFDHALMEDNEYPAYQTDRWDTHWKMFQRKYPDLDQGTMAKAIAVNAENAAYNPYMKKKFAEEYGCPSCYNQLVQVPHERFHKYYRGIKAATMDMRRRKGELLELYGVMMEDEILPGLEKALAADTSECMVDLMIPLLAHTMMSNKQWDVFYWPYLKQLLDRAQEAGQTVMIYLENSLIRFKDNFQDYPKGFLTLVPELDPVTELREAIPNACIVGGVTADALGRGTAEQCVDMAKEAIESMGDGFILGQNKMMSFRNDCKRENLLAVCDYVQNFRW